MKSLVGIDYAKTVDKKQCA